MRYWYSILILLTISCRPDPGHVNMTLGDATCPIPVDTVYVPVAKDSALPARIVAFAKTLIGTPYKFGCTAPATGFDCSGFITYVFNHFNIDVPRSSVDFTNEGTPVSLEKARPGDLILFTGTNSKIRIVGHIGLIVSNDDSGIHFIHSSSGKENAVMISGLNEGYITRFVKIIRII